MFRLAWKNLARRKGSFLASLVVLFVGGIVVMACGGLLETGIRGAVPPQRLAAAPVVISGDQSYPGRDSGNDLDERVLVDAGALAKVSAAPGVSRAIPDVDIPMTVGNRPVQGHGFSSAVLTPVHLTAGTAPRGPDDVVLDAGTAAALKAGPGQVIDTTVRGVPHVFRVTGITSAAPTPELLFTDAEATALFDRPGKIDDIGVFTADTGIQVPGTTTLTGDERGLAEFPDAGQAASNLIPLAAVFGGLATLVAMFVVSSTLALVVQQRAREMALLRAVGTTPGQLRRMVLAETLVVAVLAAGAAVWPGLWLGRWMYARMTEHGLAPDVLVFHESWIPKVAACGVTLLSATAAAFLASRRAAVARPTEALTDASLQRRWLGPVRLIAALLCLGGGTALAIVTATVMSGLVAASTATPAAMLWAAGFALLAPGLTRVLVAVLRWPLRAVTGLSGWLAVLNARGRRVRLAAAVTPIMLVTGLATALIYLQTSQDAAAQRQYTDGLRSDAVLSSASGALPPDLVGTIAGLPQVAAATAYASGTGHLEVPLPVKRNKHGKIKGDTVDADEITLHGVSAAGAAPNLADQAVSGSYTGLTGNAIAVPTDTGHHVGDPVDLRFGDGVMVPVRVVATFVAPRGFDSALVPADLLLPHTTSGELTQILVKARPGVSAAALSTALHATNTAGLVVADRDTAVAAYAQGEQTSAWISYLLVAVILGYAAISLVNTLVVATAERRREFALQRLIGSTRGQVLRMTLIEAVLVAVLGSVLGTAVAAATLVPFTLALNRSVLPSGPIWIYPAVVAAALALALLTTFVPANLVLRAKPVTAAVG